MPDRHWSNLQESTSVFGIKLLYWIYRLGGRVTFMLTLWPVIVGYWLAVPRVRQASSGYFEHLHKSGHFPSKPGIFHQLRHIFHFADTILDKILAVSGHFSARDLQVEGLDELLVDPSGGVLVTSHTGCLELCSMLREHFSSRKVRILVHTKHAQQFKRIIARINPTFHLDHIEVTELTPAVAIALQECVSEGDFIVIVGDRTPIASQAVCRADFLGQSASFPIGPFLLGLLLNCRIWNMICTRNPSKRTRYALYFSPLWAPRPVARSQRQNLFRTLAQGYAIELERRLSQSPYDWFNFFDFWQAEQSAVDTQKPRRQG